MAFDDNNVFINCPFDDDFRKLLRPLIFTLVYFQLEPKIAQTETAANPRINQIMQHIRDSKYSIHDLSRSEPMKKDELPRFNMPYELGLDIGCASFGSKKYSSKKILILEAVQYHSKVVLSDISGQDMECHNNDPATLIQKVRNWFSSIDDTKEYPGGNSVWIAYNQFYEDVKKTLSDKDFTPFEIENMPIGDFIKFAKDWINNFIS